MKANKNLDTRGESKDKRIANTIFYSTVSIIILIITINTNHIEMTSIDKLLNIIRNSFIVLFIIGVPYIVLFDIFNLGSRIKLYRDRPFLFRLVCLPICWLLGFIILLGIVIPITESMFSIGYKEKLKNMRIEKEQEEEEAQIAKEKQEEEAQIAKEKQEEEARIAKEKQEEEARIEKEKQKEVAELMEKQYISNQDILELISKAHNSIYEIYYGQDSEAQQELPGDGVYAPLRSEFNTYEKLDKYLQQYWSKGYTEVFLNDIKDMLKIIDGKYYMLVGDPGPNINFLDAIVLEVQNEENRKRVLLEASHIFGYSGQFEKILVFEDEKWKVTDELVGTIKKSDIFIEEIDMNSIIKTNDEIEVRAAEQIAKSSYPNYTNWSEGELGQNTYGEVAYVFTAFSGQDQYVIFVDKDGNCYARFIST